ncbi:MAG: hypothetical protein KGI97_02355 [Alphaproteobacteria bacterium]|nr:hypothetical protein [Alphaproteobacteria bacterium]
MSVINPATGRKILNRSLADKELTLYEQRKAARAARKRTGRGEGCDTFDDKITRQEISAANRHQKRGFLENAL